jgi:hypothetical protein
VSSSKYRAQDYFAKESKGAAAILPLLRQRKREPLPFLLYVLQRTKGRFIAPCA